MAPERRNGDEPCRHVFENVAMLQRLRRLNAAVAFVRLNGLIERSALRTVRCRQPIFGRNHLHAQRLRDGQPLRVNALHERRDARCNAFMVIIKGTPLSTLEAFKIEGAG